MFLSCLSNIDITLNLYMKSLTIIRFLDLYVLLIYTAYSAPTLLFPQLAKKVGLNYILIGICFSSYPLSAFFGSYLICKIMKDYKKTNLLLIFNTLGSLARLSFGFLGYIDNQASFFILALFSRSLTGFAEGCLTPIIYSFVPEYCPVYQEMMMEIGIMEAGGLIGAAAGAPIASLIYENFGYFSTFEVLAFCNFLFGAFIIVFVVNKGTIQDIKILAQSEKLNMKDLLFKNAGVLLNFFANSLFAGPNFLIMVGFEIYIKSLIDNEYWISFIISLLWIGSIFGVLIFKLVYKIEYENKLLLTVGLIEILVLPFYGPDPFFAITDKTACLVLMGLAFFLTGIAMEITFMITTKKLLVELLKVFPEKKELCIDAANSMYAASFKFIEFVVPIIVGLLLESVSYSRISTIYDIILLLFFCLYWFKIDLNDNQYSTIE